MKTYILKYDVYNAIEFPKGTIVKVIDPEWEFEVAEGKLKGKRGYIEGGLKEWLLENNIENRNLLIRYKKESKRLEKAIQDLDKEWDSLKSVEKLTDNE